MRGRAGERAAGSNEKDPTETRAVLFAENRSEQPRIQTLESSVITLGRAILETLIQTLEFSVITHRKQNEKCSAATGAEECNEKSSAVLRRAVLRCADPQRKNSKHPKRKRKIKKNTCRQGENDPTETRAGPFVTFARPTRRAVQFSPELTNQRSALRGGCPF